MSDDDDEFDGRDTTWMPPGLTREEQLALWEASGDGIDQAFWSFHRANPRIYDLLRAYARQAHKAGRGHFGIGMIYERLRWYVLVETSDPTGIKLNNNFRSRYARLLMLREPDLSHLFETRLLKTPSRLPKVIA